jgi:hypothetical protein
VHEAEGDAVTMKNDDDECSGAGTTKLKLLYVWRMALM